MSSEMNSFDLKFYKKNFDCLRKIPYVKQLMKENKRLETENAELKNTIFKLCKKLLEKDGPEVVVLEIPKTENIVYEIEENDDSVQMNDSVTPQCKLEKVESTDVSIASEEDEFVDAEEISVKEEESLDNVNQEIVLQEIVGPQETNILVEEEEEEEEVVVEEEEVVVEEEEVVVEEEEVVVEEEEEEEEVVVVEEVVVEEEEEEEEVVVVEEVVVEEEEEEEEEVVVEEEEEEEEEVVVEEEEEEEEEVVVEEEEEEEDEVYEITINSKTYYVTNEIDSIIYEADSSGDISVEAGIYKNGKPTFYKK